MITVQIAGAGAGKTFGLASKISQRLAVSEPYKTVYALTYTNSARDKIELELRKKHDGMNVKVETVHSFLLSEIIFPYSSYVLGDKYSSVSFETLPTEAAFKNARIKKLKENGVIHVDNVYMVSKHMLDRSNAKNRGSYAKSKVDFVCNLLKDLICSIFIDEVQDLDEDCFKVFHILGMAGIYIYMIGDPKQAIKYPGSFIDYIEENNKEGSGVVFEEINNISRRVPTSSLLFSNSLCYIGQEQTNHENYEGSVHCIYNDTYGFDIAIKHALINGKLVIINQKNDFYDTQKEKENHIPYTLARAIEYGPKRNNRDPQLYVNSVYLDLMDRINSNPTCPTKFAVNYVVGIHELAPVLRSFNAFGIFYEFAEKCANNKNPSKVVVKSIEAVKGLDSDVVFLILSDSFCLYLRGDEIAEQKRFNKEWKKLYVALTRSKDKLIFVLDKRVINEENLKLYEDFFASKNVSFIHDGNECLEWF